MASVYGYCTIADVEALSGVDYSAVYAGYTDTVIEANITQSEREINAKVGASFNGTIPDAIISLTIELTYRRLYNRMVWDGFMDREHPKTRLMPIWDEQLEGILTPYLTKNVAPIKTHSLYTGNTSIGSGLSRWWYN